MFPFRDLAVYLTTSAFTLAFKNNFKNNLKNIPMQIAHGLQRVQIHTSGRDV